MYGAMQSIRAGWHIPDDPAFRTGVLIATVVYLAAMLVLFLLFRRACRKLPKPPEKEKSPDAEIDLLTSKSCTHHPPESETDVGR